VSFDVFLYFLSYYYRLNTQEKVLDSLLRLEFGGLVIFLVLVSSPAPGNRATDENAPISTMRRRTSCHLPHLRFQLLLGVQLLLAVQQLGLGVDSGLLVRQ
jgi:hypothetical protein